MTAGRWLCHNCNHRFNTPDYSLVESADVYPIIPHRLIAKYKCPECGSTNVAGSANSHPFTPKQVKRK